MKPSAEEFERLALEQLDLLYRVARRLARDGAAAEDLVQETYLRALRSRGTFDLQEFGIRPWLLRILHNLHVTRAQREGRQPAAVGEESLEASGGNAACAGSAGHGPPIDPRSWEGMDERLVRAVEGLPDDYRGVLLLWAVEELSYKEIAEALDIPIGTVMSRLHRARQKLSDQLHGFAVEEGLVRESKE